MTGAVPLSDINDPLHQTRLLALRKINTQQITNAHTGPGPTQLHTHTHTAALHHRELWVRQKHD